MKSKGFTLIELMVVVAILAMLALLLMPMAKRSIEKARRARCANNLKTLSQAWMTATVDREGVLPGSAHGDGHNRYGVPPTYWDRNPPYRGWIHGGQARNAIENGVLWDYIRDEKVYQCPSWPFPKIKLRNHYQMNWYIGAPYRAFGPEFGGAVEFVQVRSPSQQILFVETCIHPSDARVDSFQPHAWGPDRGVIGYWHDGGCNIAFCDGRVEYKVWEDDRIWRWHTGEGSRPDMTDEMMWLWRHTGARHDFIEDPLP